MSSPDGVSIKLAGKILRCGSFPEVFSNWELGEILEDYSSFPLNIRRMEKENEL